MDLICAKGGLCYYTLPRLGISCQLRPVMQNTNSLSKEGGEEPSLTRRKALEIIPLNVRRGQQPRTIPPEVTFNLPKHLLRHHSLFT